MSDVAETAVIARLRAAAGVTALVGTRIEPLHNTPSAGTPRIVVLRPEGQQNTMTSIGLAGVSFTPIVVACIGETYAESRSLCQPVIDALEVNPSAATQWNSTEIGSCQLDDTFDRSALPQLGDELGGPVEFAVFLLEHASERSS